MTCPGHENRGLQKSMRWNAHPLGQYLHLLSLSLTEGDTVTGTAEKAMLVPHTNPGLPCSMLDSTAGPPHKARSALLHVGQYSWSPTQSQVRLAPCYSWSPTQTQVRLAPCWTVQLVPHTKPGPPCSMLQLVPHTNPGPPCSMLDCTAGPPHKARSALLHVTAGPPHKPRSALLHVGLYSWSPTQSQVCLAPCWTVQLVPHTKPGLPCSILDSTAGPSHKARSALLYIGQYSWSPTQSQVCLAPCYSWSPTQTLVCLAPCSSWSHTQIQVRLAPCYSWPHTQSQVRLAPCYSWSHTQKPGPPCSMLQLVPHTKPGPPCSMLQLTPHTKPGLPCSILDSTAGPPHKARSALLYIGQYSWSPTQSQVRPAPCYS